MRAIGSLSFGNLSFGVALLIPLGILVKDWVETFSVSTNCAQLSIYLPNVSHKPPNRSIDMVDLSPLLRSLIILCNTQPKDAFSYSGSDGAYLILDTRIMHPMQLPSVSDDKRIVV